MEITRGKFANEKLILGQTSRFANDLSAVDTPQLFIAPPVRQILAVKELRSVCGRCQNGELSVAT